MNTNHKWQDTWQIRIKIPPSNWCLTCARIQTHRWLLLFMPRCPLGKRGLNSRIRNMRIFQSFDNQLHLFQFKIQPQIDRNHLVLSFGATYKLRPQLIVSVYLDFWKLLLSYKCKPHCSIFIWPLQGFSSASARLQHRQIWSVDQNKDFHRRSAFQTVFDGGSFSILSGGLGRRRAGTSYSINQARCCTSTLQ